MWRLIAAVALLGASISHGIRVVKLSSRSENGATQRSDSAFDSKVSLEVKKVWHAHRKSNGSNSYDSASCAVSDWKGDGYCDDDNNNAGCDYDGGDCCGGSTQYCTECRCKESGSSPPSGSCKRSRSSYQDRIDSLLSEREGFGANTKGGKDGQVYVVSSTDDSGCSLSDALHDTDSLWIVFDNYLDGKTIRSNKVFKPESYKTVDGRGVNVRIYSPPSNKPQNDPEKNPNNCRFDSIFEIENRQHIIISDLRLYGQNPNPWRDGGECQDAIYMESCSNIWVNHNLMQDWEDLAVEVRVSSNLNRDISITGNKATEMKQGFVFSATRLTFARNYMDDVMNRIPKVADGYTHSYNNVIDNFQATNVQQTEGTDGYLYSQENMFNPIDGKDENWSGPNIYCTGNKGYRGSGKWSTSGMNDCPGNSQSFGQQTGDAKSAGNSLYNKVKNEAGPRNSY